jgi:GH24 family phage-related lysozyme (muramidase)
MKTFWPGWTNQQYPDGRIVWTDPDGQTSTTHPGSRLLFPELCRPTAKTIIRGVPPPKHTSGRTMPRRKTTRTHARRQRINDERQHNIPNVTQHLRQSIAPF